MNGRTRWAAALFVAALAILGQSSNARAALVTETYDVTLGGFIDIGSGAVASPVAAITGSFTRTLDNLLSNRNNTADIVVRAFGGILFDTNLILFGTDNFFFNLKFTDPAHPRFALCGDGYACGSAPGSTLADGYTRAGFSNDGWLATTGSLTPPEPATWSVLLAGLGMLAVVARRRATQLQPRFAGCRRNARPRPTL